MTRRCSLCSHIGHNSRTCPNRGVKLFGVRLTDGSIRKSASMGNLTHYPGSNQPGSSNPGSPVDTPDNAARDGYASEDFVRGSSSTSRQRKKVTPWTVEEHKLFLLGLQKIGKGHWRDIARNYVVSRTPTQVASHAQKYFLSQTNVSRRRRRSRLFDIVADESRDAPMVEQDFLAANQPQAETEGDDPFPDPPTLDKEVHESMDSIHTDDEESASLKLDSSQSSYQAAYPPYFYSPFPPLPLPYWPGYSAEPTKREAHKVVKPTPVHSKSPINVDELVGMSKLSLGDSVGDSGTSSLSLKLLEGPSRLSAFHATPSCRSSDANGSGTDGV